MTAIYNITIDFDEENAKDDKSSDSSSPEVLRRSNLDLEIFAEEIKELYLTGESGRVKGGLSLSSATYLSLEKFCDRVLRSSQQRDKLLGDNKGEKEVRNDIINEEIEKNIQEPHIIDVSLFPTASEIEEGLGACFSCNEIVQSDPFLSLLSTIACLLYTSDAADE